MAVRKPIAKPKKPKTPRQRLLAQVHIAKKELALDDATYRDILGGYGHESAGEMTDKELRILVEHLKQRGWKPKRPKSAKQNHGWGKNKYKNLGYRAGEKASGRELRTIEGLWSRVSRAENKAAALRTFLVRRWKIGDITWIDCDQAPKIINVLKEMYWRKIIKDALREWTEKQIKAAIKYFLAPDSTIRTGLFGMYQIFGGHDASDIISRPDKYWVHAIRVMYRLEKQ